jgi:flagellar basal-body rod protein FlgF
METPLYISLARMNTLRRQLDVVANNVANLSTTGFKAQRMQFVEFLERASTEERYSMPIDLVTTRDQRAGPLTPTNNPLDVALQGEGYLVVSSLNGDRYTRVGSLHLNPNRQLVDGNGLPLQSEGGQPITIPISSTQISITTSGDVSTEDGPLGKLRMVRFDEDQQLEELGGGLHATDQTPRPATELTLTQGMLEGSNVQGVQEMTQMIEILRQYQSTQRLIEGEHERMRTTNRQLPRLSA